MTLPKIHGEISASLIRSIDDLQETAMGIAIAICLVGG